MTKNNYKPELGQAMFGNKWQPYEMPEYAVALFLYIIKEIKRVYWNKNQEEWDMNSDPKLCGIEWGPYWWGDEEAPEALLPNFKYGKLEISWYKHPGRGMSCNQNLQESGWITFFNEIIKDLHREDSKHCGLE